MLPCFVGKCVSRCNLRKAVGSSVGSWVGSTWKGRLDEKIAEVCLSCAARKQWWTKAVVYSFDEDRMDGGQTWRVRDTMKQWNRTASSKARLNTDIKPRDTAVKTWHPGEEAVVWRMLWGKSSRQACHYPFCSSSCSGQDARSLRSSWFEGDRETERGRELIICLADLCSIGFIDSHQHCSTLILYDIYYCWLEWLNHWTCHIFTGQWKKARHDYLWPAV
jgi:hypothetical protein